MKRWMKSLTLLLLLSMILVIVAHPALAEGVKKVTIMINQTWNKPSMEKLARDFEEVNPDIKIDYQVVPDNAFGQLLNAKIASKEVPEIIMDNYQSLAKTVNMSETFVEFSDQAWYGKLLNKEQIVLDGGAYLLPINGSGDPFGIVYNTEVYETAGVTVPTTWEEFIDVCETLKDSGVIPVLLTGKDAWTIGMWTVTMFPNVVFNDPNLTWEDLNIGKVKFSDVEGFHWIFEALNTLVEKGYVNDDYLACTYDMGQEMISNGEVAMTLQGSWFINECVSKFPNAQFSMYPFPFIDNAQFCSGQWSGFNVFKDATNVEPAMQFINFCARPENMAKISGDWNFIPPFAESETELPYWIKDFMKNYLDKGAVPIEEMAITSAIEIGHLTTLTIDMLAGGQTAEEVLANWDAKFAELATLRQLEGWK